MGKIIRGEYEVVRKGSEEILKIDANLWDHSPSIEDNPLVMLSVIDHLVEVPYVTRIIFDQRKYYEYNYKQTEFLVEIAKVYSHLIKQKKIFSLEHYDEQERSSQHAMIQYVVYNLLRTDPIGAYVELKRLIRVQKIKLMNEQMVSSRFLDLLEYVYVMLDKTKLINAVRESLPGYVLGDRLLYRHFLRANITPDFIYTRLMAQLPLNSEEVDSYSLEDSNVKIFQTENELKLLYHITPPELTLSEDMYDLLNLAREVLAEHKPREEEFVDPEKMRRTFLNIGIDLIIELAESKGFEIAYKDVVKVANILVRYTVGFGMIEILLQDPKIQDIVINSPIGQTPLFIVHQDYGDCITNIRPGFDDAESWATKFRLLSGRPLDEANPVLDTELILPSGRARVAIMTRPLSPDGLSYALRRHRDKPWTLPLFIQNKMISPLAAGLLSFLVDGARTMLFAGTRSSGKTSLLGSALLEIMRKHRVITVEDSVAGDSEVLIKKSGQISRTTVGKLIDSCISNYGCWYNLSGHEILGNDYNIEILAMDNAGKIKWTNPSKLIRHKVKKPIYKITTRTGRQIKVTGDHSLFGLGDNVKIIEVKPKNLCVGNYIATPSKLPCNIKPVRDLNILDYIQSFEKGFLCGCCVKKFLNDNRNTVIELAEEYNYHWTTINKWFRVGLIPIKIVKRLFRLGLNYSTLLDYGLQMVVMIQNQ